MTVVGISHVIMIDPYPLSISVLLIMAYNPDAVSSMSLGMHIFYVTSSPFLAATASTVVILLMHFPTFSVPRRTKVCVDKEPSITGPQNSSLV